MPISSEFSDYEPLIRSDPSKRSNRDAVDEERFPVKPSADKWSQKLEDGPNVPVRIDQPARAAKRKSVLRHGHTISFLGLFLFTLVLYFRPYELIPALAALDKLAFWLAIVTLLIFLPTQFALEGNITAPLREVKLVMLLCLAGLLSIPFALSSTEAWNEFNDVFIKAVVMFIVMVNVVRTPRRLYLLIYVVLGVTLLLSLNAVMDYRSGNFTVEGYRIKGMLGGMFGNPNDLALHFVTMIPLAVALTIYKRNLIWKLLFGGIAALTVAASVVTYSRGGFLGLMAVGGVMAWKLGRRHRLRVSVISVIVLTLFILLAPGNYGVRILSIFVPGLDAYGSGASRQEVLNRSVIISLRHPITGIGMGNFHTMSLHETVSHNAFTQVSAEMGYAALIVYLMFLTGPMRRLRMIEQETFGARKPSHYYYLAIGLQASLVGFMVTAFFAAVAYQWYAYYLVGYAVCLRRLYEADEKAQLEAATVISSAPVNVRPEK
jgi:O-antigen ligase